MVPSMSLSFSCMVVIHLISRGEIFEIFESLRRCLVEILAERFVFDQQDASPEKVDGSCVLIVLLYGPFKNGDLSAFDPEDLQKLIPKGLRFGTLALFVLPLVHKSDRVVSYFGLG